MSEDQDTIDMIASEAHGLIRRLEESPDMLWELNAVLYQGVKVENSRVKKIGK